MKNKILVEIIIPKFDERYNLFLPISKKVGSAIILINKAITELSNGIYVCDNNATLYNRITGESYDPNALISKTNIRNGTILVLD